MKPEEIQITDYMRLLLGKDIPWLFLIEVVIRVAYLYFLILFSMRLMGKRMSAQLNRNEMAAMVSLAAAVGVPLLAPDRGLLPPLIMAAVVICYQQIIARISRKNRDFEAAAQDKLTTLVKDSTINWDGLKKTTVSRERLFAQLRSEGIRNLGEAERVYMEMNGSFTVIKYPEPRPGLCILPDWDEDFRKEMDWQEGQSVCCHCGKLEQKKPDARRECPECGHHEWEQAIMPVEPVNRH